MSRSNGDSLKRAADDLERGQIRRPAADTAPGCAGELAAAGPAHVGAAMPSVPRRRVPERPGSPAPSRTRSRRPRFRPPRQRLMIGRDRRAARVEVERAFGAVDPDAHEVRAGRQVETWNASVSVSAATTPPSNNRAAVGWAGSSSSRIARWPARTVGLTAAVTAYPGRRAGTGPHRDLVGRSRSC